MAYSVTILDSRTITDPSGSIPPCQHADLTVTDGTTVYVWSCGGIPVGTDPGTYCTAIAQQLFTAAKAAGAPTQTSQKTANQAAANALTTDPDAPNVLSRAALYMIGDEFNDLIAWINAFSAAVAAATSLANLQTRIAALSKPPTLTVANVLAAWQAKINSGAAS